MMWLAGLRAEHPRELAATFRETFGVSICDVGTSLAWREAIDLAHVAIDDPSTRLGAKVAGWDYPASPADIAQIIMLAAFGVKSAAKLMPFDPHAGPKATEAEIAAAQAQLEEEFIFS